MCKIKSFCGCMTLKVGVLTALIISLVYSFFLLLFAVFKVHVGVDKDDYWQIGRGVALVCLIVLFCIGTIGLAFSFLTNKPGLTLLWLIVSMIFMILIMVDTLFLIYDVLIAISFESWEYALDIIETVLIVLLDAFLIYLWIVVLNYYWDLKRKDKEKKAHEPA